MTWRLSVDQHGIRMAKNCRSEPASCSEFELGVNLGEGAIGSDWKNRTVQYYCISYE